VAGNRFPSDHMAGGRAQSLVFGVLPSGLCGRPGSASQSTKGDEHGVRVFPLGVRAVLGRAASGSKCRL
jgi:hypothetical protein